MTALHQEQVLLEAKGKWKPDLFTTSQVPDAFYRISTPIRRYRALDALQSVRREYPDDPFWDTADMLSLEHELIRRIDIDLSQQGTSYLEMMRRPNRAA